MKTNQGKTPKQENDSLKFATIGVIVILLVCFLLFVLAVINTNYGR